jgi:murein DD-endopeptidase MepM/ murein hydrolase activator NlpD
MLSTVHRFAWGVTKSRFLLSAAAAVMLAACSNSVERFSENPSDSDPVYTASVPKNSEAPSYDAPQSDEIASSPLANSNVKQPAYDYSKSYKKPAYRQPEVASQEADIQAPAPQLAKVDAPRAESGGTVEVGPGMTLYSIARANNVSVSQLAAANNIKPPYAVRTGQKLRIPGASAPVTPEVTTARAEQKLVPQPAKAPAAHTLAKGGHTVKSGDTLFSLGRKYGVSPFTIADANGLPHNAQLHLGQSLKIPGGSAPTASASSTRAPAAEDEAPVQQQAEAAPSKIPAADAADVETVPAKQATAETTAPATSTESVPQTVAEVPAEADATGMRWPVRGKVISGFGPKSNGLKNEGINIAVPEGTSVRAAESGVVAYAGNELKGYGNLVLIRHDDGYVTAYAHAKELFVKRGDTVKRGDVIAKAGQTGSVSSPQLHFEVRKGATALDPMKYLSAATAAN